MEFLLDIVAVIQWLLFAYMPLTALYGILRLIARPDVIDTICSPFLGLKKVSVKSGFIIWMMQMMLFGFVLNDIIQWIRFGINPLIQLW